MGKLETLARSQAGVAGQLVTPFIITRSEQLNDNKCFRFFILMSSHSVSANLAVLSDSVKLTFQLIHRLSKLSFQPGSTPLDEHGDVRLELAQDIRDSLKHNEDSLETAKQEVDDLIGSTSTAQRRRDSIKDRDRARIAAQVARLEEDLKQ